MKSSYNEDDVILLLNDVTDKIKPVTQEQRRILVEKGEYVRSIIIKEYEVSKEYTKIVNDNMDLYIENVAKTVGILAEKLYTLKKNDLVLVDIARAGIPIGILLKRYLKMYHNVDIPHYSISLVQGLDPKAMEYIINKHGTKGIQFIDGWTGKGTVAKEIKRCVEKYYPDVDWGLGVLSDCINVAKYVGTREDIYIPHSPLNAAVTGLVSITVKNEKFDNPSGFHSAIYLKELEEDDQSAEYIERVVKQFTKQENIEINNELLIDDTEIDKISKLINTNKKELNPGINEAARAVLRRDLKKLIVQDKNDKELAVLIKLASSKNIPVEEMPLNGYKAVSVAKDNYIR